MINLEVPAKFKQLVDQAHQAAAEFFRPHSRKYDQAEHTYPRELDMLAALLDGLSASGGGAGAGGVRRGGAAAAGNQNGANLRLLLGTIEMCWGDVGLLLSMPRQGLGNAAIASVANDEQLARYQGKWAAMAITEPDTGSDSGAIRTTAVLDGDHYVLNGEKIFVTAGERADCVVVWATLDRALGKAAIKSFVVDRGTPGFDLVRLEHKLGIRASDTAHFRLDNVRVHRDNLLGSPEINPTQGFAGVMQTFDNTRPLVAAMAVGVARAALEETRRILTDAGITIDYDRPAFSQPAAAATFLQLEADWEAAYLLSLEAAWMADNRKPNSLQASMAKAKAGRSASDITLRCVELTGSLGYSENSLLEKWARDSKILDIFEGTQQIQQLIVARRLLGKSSSELR
ncbi:acyl-CoA dehydrogenase family protein [Actinokineospora diospyrosa]|uniref:Acyl-CoA dehydrogenase n=1 Tax=Actinokineospora diospyrosa TaxID=103728 RepID=A0ABT1I7Q4_9PSEU|nr:acyl-CoA dehydrogenase family protein [Actinokineospora diospyrosa]MCP2268652.1 acyl-CoA dehydrogenase [Actinokineospora diospyrosa]